MLDSSTVTIYLGDSYTDADATCTDNIDGNIEQTSTSTVDTSMAGTYEVTYSCQDDANNNAVQVSRTVIVDAASDITVQVITLTAVYNIRNDSTLKFDDPRSITTFESGGHTYAAVTSHNDDGVQILDVTGPSSITAAGSITDNAGLELDRAIGITVFESGGHTYAAVTSYNAVQIIRIDIIVPDNTPPVITLNGPPLS